jgi:hypothetical protein
MLFTTDLPQIDTKFTLEIRERFEHRLNKDFLSGNPDDRSDAFMRLRPGLELKLGKSFSAMVQYQVSHDWVRTQAAAYTVDNNDAAQAYVRFADKGGTFTIGRQKIIVGSERLIGASEWTNVGRSFDGARFQTKDWDAFAATVGVASPRPEHAELFGLVHKGGFGQTMFAYKRDKVAAGNQRIWTLDQSQSFKRGALDFDYDVAVQGGNNAGIDHRAWAAHGGLGYRHDAKNRVYLDLNSASGGHAADRSETFDNLYPTNHKFYGSMDMQGWRNMQEVALGWQHVLNPKVDLHVHSHWFGLMDAKDAWYGAGGSANKRLGGTFKDATGASGKNVGFEIDLEGAYKMNPKTTCNFGIASFNPGTFIKNMNGGSADRQTWLFFQINHKM